MIVGIYNPPALVTMAGLVCGALACLLASFGFPAFAVVALIWAGIFDLFDGMVARRMHVSAREAAFGVQIDSIVDMVSFGVAPVMVAISLGMEGVGAIAGAVLYICAAAQRLAYFNLLQTEAEGRVKTYTGLPVTFSALIFGIAFTLVTLLSEKAFSYVMATLFVFISVLFVAPIKIRKPGGAVYLIMPMLAAAFTGVWLVIGLNGVLS